MADPPVERTVYAFGAFVFEPFNDRLVSGDRVIPLTAKATDTLRSLVQQPDILVTKEALLESVWPDTLVHENNLNQQISLLRKALGETGEIKFIETVARRGYRFVAPVRIVSTASSASIAAEHAHPAFETTLAAKPPVGLTGPGRRRVPWLAVAAGLIAVTGVGLGGRYVWQQRQQVASSNAAIGRGTDLMQSGDQRAAIAELQKAIAINPNNAKAYGVLAHALHKSSMQTHRTDAAAPALEAARRGAAIDPSCADCRGTFGFFLFYYDWQWAEAEAQLKEALRLDPGRDAIRPPYAMLLMATGRTTEALEEIERALAKRPYEQNWLGIRASILYAARRYTEALAATDRALAVNDRDNAAWDWRSRILFQLGRRDEAVRAMGFGTFSSASSILNRATEQGGADAGFRELLDRTSGFKTKGQQAWRRAAWCAMLGDEPGALAELETGYERRIFNMIYTGVDPLFDSLRPQSRFQKVLAGLGLADRQRP